MTYHDDGHAQGDERCDSCRRGLDAGEPYETRVLGPVPGRQEPAVTLWCLNCAYEEAA